MFVYLDTVVDALVVENVDLCMCMCHWCVVKRENSIRQAEEQLLVRILRLVAGRQGKGKEIWAQTSPDYLLSVTTTAMKHSVYESGMI